MKGKRTTVYLALLCLFIALFIPLAASADDCSPENPNCKIEPPQSIEVNPDPLHADGSPVELEEPGALSPQLIPMPLPRNVDPLPLPAGDATSFETLPVPLRLQDPTDVSCGVQALGMALDGLDSSAPASAVLLSFLEENGMMYDFGTGVEELAYAAQSLGFEGSLAFHGWTVEDLQSELSAGRPVVVALGANGEANPGHFVTVTGISPDGQWIAFSDPTLGEQVLSMEEFLRLWSMQGNSGVMVRAESPIPGLDLMPWVTFLAGLMALITQTPLLRWRRGIGGRLDPGVGVSLAPDPPTPPVYVAPPKPTPVYVPPAPQPPAPQPAAIEPPTENDRLTELEQRLDPVIPPEPTPKEAKLTRLEQQFDPLILPNGNSPQLGEASSIIAIGEGSNCHDCHDVLPPHRNDQDEATGRTATITWSVFGFESRHNLDEVISSCAVCHSPGSVCTIDDNTDSELVAVPSLAGGTNITMQRGTFIGDNPFSVLPSGYDPGSIYDPLPIERIINGYLLATGNEDIRTAAYGEYINSQDPNVLAELSCSQSDEGTLIQHLVVANTSGYSLNMRITIERGGATTPVFGPTLLQDERMGIIFADPDTPGRWIQDGLLIPATQGATVTIWFVASTTDPPMIRTISFDLPSGENPESEP